MFINYELPKDFEILEYHQGHFPSLGKSAGQELNPYWKVKNKTVQDEPFYVMYCKPDTLCYISENSIDTVLNSELFESEPTWYLLKNGYVGAHTVYNGTKTILYMHQIIMDFYDLENRKKSIDHINRNKLDNRTCNLRIVSQSINNANTGKRKRKKSAKELPDGIIQSDLPKYVVYYKEIYNKKTGATREWFNIEKHPKQSKRWSTTKSGKVDITDKLELAKKKLEEIDAL